MKEKQKGVKLPFIKKMLIVIIGIGAICLSYLFNIVPNHLYTIKADSTYMFPIDFGLYDYTDEYTEVTKYYLFGLNSIGPDNITLVSTSYSDYFIFNITLENDNKLIYDSTYPLKLYVEDPLLMNFTFTDDNYNTSRNSFEIIDRTFVQPRGTSPCCKLQVKVYYNDMLIPPSSPFTTEQEIKDWFDSVNGGYGFYLSGKFTFYSSYNTIFNYGNEVGYESGYDAGLNDNVNNQLYYDGGYDDGYEVGYSSGLNDGLVDSTNNDSHYYEGYDDGYNQGILLSDGYNTGYENGLIDGKNNPNLSLKDLVFDIIEAPVNIISNAFNFEIFGINFGTLVIALVSFALLFCAIKIGAKYL